MSLFKLRYKLKCLQGAEWVSRAQSGLRKPIPPPPCRLLLVTPGKWLPFSRPRFSHLENGGGGHSPTSWGRWQHSMIHTLIKCLWGWHAALRDAGFVFPIRIVLSPPSSNSTFAHPSLFQTRFQTALPPGHTDDIAGERVPVRKGRCHPSLDGCWHVASGSVLPHLPVCQGKLETLILVGRPTF